MAPHPRIPRESSTKRSLVPGPFNLAALTEGEGKDTRGSLGCTDPPVLDMCSWSTQLDSAWHHFHSQEDGKCQTWHRLVHWWTQHWHLPSRAAGQEKGSALVSIVTQLAHGM